MLGAASSSLQRSCIPRDVAADHGLRSLMWLFSCTPTSAQPTPLVQWKRGSAKRLQQPTLCKSTHIPPAMILSHNCASGVRYAAQKLKIHAVSHTCASHWSSASAWCGQKFGGACCCSGAGEDRCRRWAGRHQRWRGARGQLHCKDYLRSCTPGLQRHACCYSHCHHQQQHCSYDYREDAAAPAAVWAQPAIEHDSAAA